MILGRYVEAVFIYLAVGGPAVVLHGIILDWLYDCKNSTQGTCKIAVRCCILLLPFSVCAGLLLLLWRLL